MTKESSPGPKDEDWQHPGSDGKVHRVVLPASGGRHGVKDRLANQGRTWGPSGGPAKGRAIRISVPREIGEWRQAGQIGSPYGGPGGQQNPRRGKDRWTTHGPRGRGQSFSSRTATLKGDP